MVLQLFISSIGVAAGVLFLIRKYKEYFIWGWCKSKRRMEGKVVVITGGNSGIGKETAKELASRGAIVVLACRNRQKALEAIQHIREYTKNGDLIFCEIDLANLESVKKCATNLIEKFPQIDVLVNNAGVSIPPEYLERTCDGFEIHFGVNHLGHFYLTDLLLNKLKKSRHSRIINVSSMLYTSGKIEFDNLRLEKGVGHLKGRNPLYSASKLANILHALELRKRIKETNVGIYALSPGFIYTGLMRHTKLNWLKKLCFLPIAALVMRSSTQGAQTSIYCAVSEELDSIPFGFFRDCHLENLVGPATDDKLTKQVYDVSLKLINEVM